MPSYKIAQWKPSTKDKIVQCRRPSRQGQTINPETAIAKGKGKRNNIADKGQTINTETAITQRKRKRNNIADKGQTRNTLPLGK